MFPKISPKHLDIKEIFYVDLLLLQRFDKTKSATKRLKEFPFSNEQIR